MRKLNLRRSLPIKRRHFIQSTLGVGMLGRSLFSFGKNKAAAAPARAVYQDMSYIDLSGYGNSYTPPKGNASTRQALKSLSPSARQTLHYWY